MAREARRVSVPSGGDVARLHAAADAGPLLLEHDGDLYRLARVPTARGEATGGDDPEALRAAIAATAGSWADLDSEALIQSIHRAREVG